MSLPRWWTDTRHWPEVVIVIGAILLVHGLTGWESSSRSSSYIRPGSRFGPSASSSAGFTNGARTEMAVGAGLLALGLVARRPRPAS